MMETTFKLLSLCDRSEVELFPDQEFDIEGFKQVLTQIAVKDVTPFDTPIKLVRDFKTFCNLFIFPFITFSVQKDMTRKLEYWKATKGIQLHEVHIKFLETEVAPSIHYITKNVF